MYMYNFEDVSFTYFLDLESGKFSEGNMQRGEDENGLVVPLLMQNKPPVEYEEDKLNDLDLRPEQVC